MRVTFFASRTGVARIEIRDTKPFTWCRKHVVCKHTIFNYVASYIDFETSFAEFLDHCLDIPRFAALGATEQSAATQFRVDYLKPSGAIGFYHPDWVAVQKLPTGQSINWIIETKGRKWEDTTYKNTASSIGARKYPNRSVQIGGTCM